MWISACGCMWVCMCVSVCVSVCMYVYMCGCRCMYACMCICLALEKNASDKEMLAHLKGLRMQGKWAQWDAVEAQDMQWQRLFQDELTDEMLKFKLNAKYRQGRLDMSARDRGVE